MFNVYAEKDIFESIVLFKDDYPNWNNILLIHSEVFLNMTDEELINEYTDGTIIFEFIQINGGREPIALKYHFENIKEDPEILTKDPRAAYFLNISESDANSMQNRFGILVQSGENINDSLLVGEYYKLLKPDAILEGGWKSLFNFRLLPSNSAVITDSYLFHNSEGTVNVGSHNLLLLLDVILPHHLETVYHILIISEDNGRPSKGCHDLASKLTFDIKALRHYEMVVEIVFSSTIHKRKIISNYYSISCDRGFALFRTADGQTIRAENDYKYESIFFRSAIGQGDTVFDSDTFILEDISSRCRNVYEYIRNRGQETDHRLLGDCNPKTSIMNRLIKIVS